MCPILSIQLRAACFVLRASGFVLLAFMLPAARCCVLRAGDAKFRCPSPWVLGGDSGETGPPPVPYNNSEVTALALGGFGGITEQACFITWRQPSPASLVGFFLYFIPRFHSSSSVHDSTKSKTCDLSSPSQSLLIRVAGVQALNNSSCPRVSHFCSNPPSASPLCRLLHCFTLPRTSFSTTVQPLIAPHDDNDRIRNKGSL